MTYFSGLPLAGADKFSQQLNKLPCFTWNHSHIYKPPNVSRETRRSIQTPGNTTQTQDNQDTPHPSFKISFI